MSQTKHVLTLVPNALVTSIRRLGGRSLAAVWQAHSCFYGCNNTAYSCKAWGATQHASVTEAENKRLWWQYILILLLVCLPSVDTKYWSKKKADYRNVLLQEVYWWTEGSHFHLLGVICSPCQNRSNHWADGGLSKRPWQKLLRLWCKSDEHCLFLILFIFLDDVSLSLSYIVCASFKTTIFTNPPCLSECYFLHISFIEIERQASEGRIESERLQNSPITVTVEIPLAHFDCNPFKFQNSLKLQHMMWCTLSSWGLCAECYSLYPGVCQEHHVSLSLSKWDSECQLVRFLISGCAERPFVSVCCQRECSKRYQPSMRANVWFVLLLILQPDGLGRVRILGSSSQGDTPRQMEEELIKLHLMFILLLTPSWRNLSCVLSYHSLWHHAIYWTDGINDQFLQP